jgi:hypothetical protein
LAARITGTPKLPNEANVSLFRLHRLINRRTDSAERSQFDQGNAKKCLPIANLLLKNAPNEPTGCGTERRRLETQRGCAQVFAKRTHFRSKRQQGQE